MRTGKQSVVWGPSLYNGSMSGTSCDGGRSHDWTAANVRWAPPLPSFRLLGLQSRWKDIGLSAGLLCVLIACRWAAFPASIWEQDEAYFGCGVLLFDPTGNSPHPPWFPLWIAVGKLTRALGNSPTGGLQLVSAAASIVVIFPLLSLWSIWLRRELALAAALLYLFSPAAWVLSGRAFSEPLAVLLLMTALACWWGPSIDNRWTLGGSCAAGLCLLTRAHFILPLLGAGLYHAFRLSTWKQRRALFMPALMLVAVGYGVVMIEAGGPGPLLAALHQHGAYHFGELGTADLSFEETGLARAFLVSWVALIWVVCALMGAWLAWRRRRLLPGLVSLFLMVGIPLCFLVYGLSWAGHVRYALPLIALGWGFVVLVSARWWGRWSLALSVALVVVQAWAVLGQMGPYREEASPPVRAIEFCLAEAGRTGSVIIADRTLDAFFDYERLRRGIPGTVLHESQIGVDTPSPPPWLTVAIYDEGRGRFVGSARSVTTFSCEPPWLRRLSQGRFLDISVAVGAEVHSAADTNGPSITMKRSMP